MGVLDILFPVREQQEYDPHNDPDLDPRVADYVAPLSPPKRQARLPKRRFEDQIKDMSIGDEGYTTPWAMWPDYEGKCWLNGNYTVHSTPGGTVSMLVTRERDGFVVDITEGHARNYQWTPTGMGGKQFVGGADVLPVIEVIS